MVRVAQHLCGAGELFATIDWASGVSGTWTTATDWSGGVVAGIRDTSVIDANASSNYTVSVTTPVTVAGLNLDQTTATLLIHESFSAEQIDLQSGTLERGKGPLEGTVAATGGMLMIGLAGGTLSGVTWQGALDPEFAYDKKGASTLTISNSLSLTGAGGNGPGVSVGFAGTLGGFAVGDRLQFGGEDISSARFVGSSIVATLAAGGTIALATTSALSGNLIVSDGNFVDYFNAGIEDWPGVHHAAAALPATWECRETAAAWLRDE